MAFVGWAMVSVSRPVAGSLQLACCIQCSVGQEERGISCIWDFYPDVLDMEEHN